MFKYHRRLSQKPTNDPKDSQDIWCKNNQKVDEREQNEGDGDVPGPVEGLVGENHLLDRSPHLRERESLFYSLL